MSGIVAMGSPLLDISAEVGKEFLEKYDLTLNNTFFAYEKQLSLFKEIIANYKYDKIPGGSSLNTVRVAQWLR